MKEPIVLLLLLSTCATVAVLTVALPPPAFVSGKDELIPRHQKTCTQLHESICACKDPVQWTSSQRTLHCTVPDDALKNDHIDAKIDNEQSCHCTKAQRNYCHTLIEENSNRMNKRAETQESKSCSFRMLEIPPLFLFPCSSSSQLSCHSHSLPYSPSALKKPTCAPLCVRRSQV